MWQYYAIVLLNFSHLFMHSFKEIANTSNIVILCAQLAYMLNVNKVCMEP